MNLNGSIATLTAEVQRQQALKKDLIADTRRLSLTQEVDGEHLAGDLGMLVDLPDGTEEFNITRWSHNQLSEFSKVPFKFYERTLERHPDLLAHLMNGLLAREHGKRMVRTLDGTVRAVVSDRYRPRDNYDLLEHLLPVLAEFPNVQFAAAQLTDSRMYVKTFLPELEIQVTPQVGDVIRGGVIISNSEIGAGSLYIYPYTDRLICTNGMVHTDYGQRRIHVGRRIESAEEAYQFYSDETMRLDDQAFFAKCADTVRGCLNQSVFEAIASQMRDLAAIRVPGSPVDAVEVIQKQQGFTEGEGKSILQWVTEGGDLSGWGYVNAITSTARDLTDPDRQTEMQIAAGRMVSDPSWAGAIHA